MLFQGEEGEGEGGEVVCLGGGEEEEVEVDGTGRGHGGERGLEEDHQSGRSGRHCQGCGLTQLVQVDQKDGGYCLP